jgi:cyanate permease
VQELLDLVIEQGLSARKASLMVGIIELANHMFELTIWMSNKSFLEAKAITKEETTEP